MNWRGFGLFFVALSVVFGGCIAYAGWIGPRLTRQATAPMNQFMQLCQKHDFAGAHKLQSALFQSSFSVAQLQLSWQQFEKVHGQPQSWAPAMSGMRGGNLVNLFPPSVDFAQQVQGKKGSSALVTLRLVPENGAWRVNKFLVYP